MDFTLLSPRASVCHQNALGHGHHRRLRSPPYQGRFPARRTPQDMAATVRFGHESVTPSRSQRRADSRCVETASDQPPAIWPLCNRYLTMLWREHGEALAPVAPE